MARIKVTGYIDTNTLDLSLVDLSHETGLSSLGFERLSGESLYLEDREFELEEESDGDYLPKVKKP